MIEEAQIRERLAIIEPHVRWIRSFSCTEGHELIPAVAREKGLKTLVGVWLDDARDFSSFNSVFKQYFKDHPPTRSTVESPLMIDAKVEMDVVAYKPL